MYRIGIDFGGTNIAVGIIDENMNILAKRSRPTKLGRPVDEMIEDMADICRELLREVNADFSSLESVGIASPGTINSSTGEVEYYCNMDLYNYPMAEKLRNALGFGNVKIANDANAAAYGEALAGSAKGAKEAVMITLGTGVGGGIITDGKIYEGHNFSAGELGHIVIVQGGEPCPCGRRGCWEQYSSATALIRQTKAEMLKNRESSMWELVGGDIGNVNGMTAFKAAKEGDESAVRVVERYEELLSCGLTNIVNIFQPEVLSIGGGISGEKENLRAPVEKLVMSEQYAKTTAHKTRIVIATLGNNAGIIGAAML